MEMDIGSKIKELRVVKGLTQEELADRAELSKGFISQVERDLTSPYPLPNSSLKTATTKWYSKTKIILKRSTAI